MSISSLPSELITEALSLAHPFEVARFAQASHTCYDLVYRQKDAYLWRRLYLAYPFDDPRRSVAALGNPRAFAFDWRRELKKKMWVAARTSDSLIDTVTNALPGAVGESVDLDWVETILRKTSFLRAPLPAGTEERSVEIQKRARLSVYVALTLDKGTDDEGMLHLIKRRTRARCAIYDFDHYTAANGYGPYRLDGSPNWVQLGNILNVVGMTLEEHPDRWKDTRPPRGVQAVRAYSAPGLEKREERDWAGMQGEWRRFACFMDYRDLFAFNFTNHLNGPKNAIYFSEPGFQEAIKLVELSLTLIDGTDTLQFLVPRFSPTLERYPTLYYKGNSQGIGTEESIEGCVEMGLDGVVRHRFISMHGGRVLWSSEGVQIGNVGSAMGVLGSWTGARHDRGDPVGPFWLWRVADDHPRYGQTAF